jgi:hypothetical protein
VHSRDACCNQIFVFINYLFNSHRERVFRFVVLVLLMDVLLGVPCTSYWACFFLRTFTVCSWCTAGVAVQFSVLAHAQLFVVNDPPRCATFSHACSLSPHILPSPSPRLHAGRFPSSHMAFLPSVCALPDRRSEVSCNCGCFATEQHHNFLGPLLHCFVLFLHLCPLHLASLYVMYCARFPHSQ